MDGTSVWECFLSMVVQHFRRDQIEESQKVISSHYLCQSENLRNKAEMTTLCMDAQDLLRMAFDDLEQVSPWACEANVSDVVRVVVNLPERALEMVCEEVMRVIPKMLPKEGVEDAQDFSENSLHFCIYSYTFDYSESEVSERIPKCMAAKICRVRLVAPAKWMFCVQLDFWLKRRDLSISDYFCMLYLPISLQVLYSETGNPLQNEELSKLLQSSDFVTWHKLTASPLRDHLCKPVWLWLLTRKVCLSK